MKEIQTKAKYCFFVHEVGKFFCYLILFFNWRKISLQCWVGFCCTTTWISHNYTYIPSLLSLPPLPHPTPLDNTEQQAGLLYNRSVIQQLLTSYLFFTLLGPEKATILKDTGTLMFIATLFTTARTWKPPRCPSTDEWMKKMWYIYIQWNFTQP